MSINADFNSWLTYQKFSSLEQALGRIEQSVKDLNRLEGVKTLMPYLNDLEQRLKKIEQSIEVVDNRLESARKVMPYLVVAGLVSAAVLVYLYVNHKSDGSNSDSEKKE